MGGTIRIIKKENNEIKSYVGWTNPVPVFTYTNKFYTDKKYASERIKKWGEVEESESPFNSSEYGVIFIDFDDKRIYECQGYCTIGRCHKSSISLSLMPNCSVYEHILEGSKEFIEDGALTYKSDIYKKIGDDYVIESSNTEYINSFDVLVKIADELRARSTLFLNLHHKGFRKNKNVFISDDFYVDISKYGWESYSMSNNKPFDFFTKLIDDGYDVSSTNFDTWNRVKTCAKRNYEGDYDLGNDIKAYIRGERLTQILE